MREITACGNAFGGAGTGRSSPSMRIRTTMPVRNGSMWMSLALRSIAFSSRSLTPRTTGAPLARSRRLSISSSARVSAASPLSDVEISSSPRRSVRAVPMSSKEPTSKVTGLPSTTSAARTHAGSLGSATARRNCPSASSYGKTHVSRRESRRKLFDQSGSRQQLLQANARQPIEACNFVGKFVGRQIGQLPQFSYHARPVRNFQCFRARANIARNAVIAEQMVCKVLRRFHSHPGILLLFPRHSTRPYRSTVSQVCKSLL